MRKTLLDNMISDLLILQKAKEYGIDVSEQVKLSIENIKQENNMQSDEQLRQAFQAQGLDFDEWKRQMEEDFLKRAVIYGEVDRHIVLDDSEIVSYYKQHPEEFTDPEEYKLRAIYLSHSGKSKEELEIKMEEITRKLRAGEDMGVLAEQYSEGPEKDSRGELGTFKEGELASELDQAVKKLKQGETTPWIETKNGWYLIRLEEKKDRRLRPFEDIKKEVEEKLFSERKKKRLQEFMKELRAKSYIKILIPNPMGQ